MEKQKIILNKVLPRPIPAASRSLGLPRQGVRRGNGENFVVEESAPPTLYHICGFIPATRQDAGILRNHNKRSMFYVLRSTSVGFTIVEAILSAFIISLAVIGPLSAARQGLAASSDSRDYIESIYLAEEAMEIVRNIRNENLLSGHIYSNWLQGLSQCMNEKICGVSPISNNQIIPCNNGNNDCELTVSSGVYSHRSASVGSDWALSGITRKMNIIERVNDVDAEITVTIERKKAGFPTRIYTWKSVLMNWMRTPP